MEEGFTTETSSEILQERINSNTFVCLSTTKPDDGKNFTEPAASTGYTRRTFGEVATGIPAQVANMDIIFLFEALENLGSFTHLGLSKSKQIGGKVFLTAKLVSPVTVDAGYVPLIRAYSLVVGLDKEALEPYA